MQNPKALKPFLLSPNTVWSRLPKCALSGNGGPPACRKHGPRRVTSGRRFLSFFCRRRESLAPVRVAVALVPFADRQLSCRQCAFTTRNLFLFSTSFSSICREHPTPNTRPKADRSIPAMRTRLRVRVGFLMGYSTNVVHMVAPLHPSY
jgi:hypothetical protein